jgi:hypothetical protein
MTTPKSKTHLSRREATRVARRILQRRRGYSNGRARTVTCGHPVSAVTVRCAAACTYDGRRVRARVKVTELRSRYAHQTMIVSRRRP